MKYLVTVMQGITVEADDVDEALEHGEFLIDQGMGQTYATEVEPLSRKENEG